MDAYGEDSNGVRDPGRSEGAPPPSTRVPAPAPMASAASPSAGLLVLPRDGAVPPPPPGTAGPPRAGIAALSLRYQMVAAFALALVAVAACMHLVMVFLHVAPSNTVTKQHGQVVDDYVYPEFEQNWKLFAPNPLQQNIAVQARAEVLMDDGGTRTTGWYDLSARDGAAIDGSLLPSHTQQNELRRAWDFYVGSHDDEGRPDGLRGDLSEQYVRRIVLMRLEREIPGAGERTIDRLQVRSRTTNVDPPPWSDEKVNKKPVDRVLPWWSVTTDDMPLSDRTRTARTESLAEPGPTEAGVR